MAIDSSREGLVFAPTPFPLPATHARRLVRRLVRWATPGLDVAALAGVLALVRPGPSGLALAGFTLLACAVGGDYRSRIAPSLQDAVPAMVRHVAIAALLVGGAQAVAGADPAASLRSAVAALPALVVARAVSFGAVRAARRSGLVRERTLIVGAGRQGVLLAGILSDHPELGLVPVGFADSFADTLDPPILGPVEHLDTLLDEFAIDRVIVAFGATREPEMVRVLRACDGRRVEVSVVPRFFELGVAPAGPDTDDVRSIPLVRLRRAALRTAAWRTKRFIDVVVAATALVLTAPVMAAAALAVRLSSPGPVLFRQRRVGQRGRHFELLKFRTMQVNGDSDTTWSVDDDQRVTRVGRILRATSIDELPQFWNVLRGDMSVVGPRPERPFFVDRFEGDVPRYGDRHRVPVGITGWAQVHGLRGGNGSIEERVRFDNFYIEHWSPWRDVVILARTLVAMWRRPT
jgi:exopolysaccharide biosynthesis polyprenyl glycosylphosphotransferase